MKLLRSGTVNFFLPGLLFRISARDYGVGVKGYSLDAEVKFIRVLGVSPETTKEEVKRVFQEEVGISAMIDI